MNVSHYIFSTEQFNRLFPYYILISKGLKIDLCGTAYNNLLTSPGRSFERLFTVDGKTIINNQVLTDLVGQSITITPLSQPGIHLHGQLEYLAQTDQFLFAGNAIKSNIPADNPPPANNKGAMQERLNFYEDILSEAPADMVIFDPEHRYIFINKTAIKDTALRERLIGLKDEDYCWLTNRPESIMQERRANFEEVLKTRQLKSWEEKVTDKNGNVTHSLLNLCPLLNEKNEVKLVIGCGMDISNRKNTEDQLMLSERKFRNLYNLSPALIYTHDMDGNIMSINPAISNTLGYSESQVVGTNIKNLLPFYDRDKVQHMYSDKLQAQGAVKGICRALHKNGKDIVYLFYQNYIAGGEGETPYVIGFSHDITARIHIENELRRAKKTTEAGARAKEIFLANMSHEIRTPMNGILGLNNLLIKTDLDEQQKGYAKLISGSVNSLLDIVNDILDIEKIGSGRLELENKPFNVSTKIKRTLQLFQYKSKEKGLDLVLNNRLPDEFAVIGDQYRFAQILSNLINNSIKFTKRGSITVSSSLLYNSEDKVLLEFSVKDTGIGIPEDRIGIIFDPFVQGSSSLTRKYGGTGLGLSICKSLVEMQGGHIKVNSKLNSGTEFIFSLTYKKGQAFSQKYDDIIEATEPDLLSNKRVLVAEDVELNQFLVKNLLESWGCEVDVAFNGEEAVEKVKTDNYDLILMDIQMPEMDGLTATRLIRQLSDPKQGNIPIIALTANALMGDSDYYMDAGMDDCVTKPYTEEFLYERMVAVLTARTGKAKLNKPVVNKVETIVNKEPVKDTVTMSNEKKLYDLTMIETISKNNTEFVNKMLVMFCDVTVQDLEKLKDAANRDDWETVGQLAHKLKSTVGNMGVDALKGVLQSLEAKNSNDPLKIVAELEHTLNAVNTQIKADHPEAFNVATIS
ncbi:MAG: PAS domain S-box protein [Mucilaginibacter sp.]